LLSSTTRTYAKIVGIVATRSSFSRKQKNERRRKKKERPTSVLRVRRRASRSRSRSRRRAIRTRPCSRKTGFFYTSKRKRKSSDHRIDLGNRRTNKPPAAFLSRFLFVSIACEEALCAFSVNNEQALQHILSRDGATTATATTDAVSFFLFFVFFLVVVATAHLFFVVGSIVVSFAIAQPAARFFLSLERERKAHAARFASHLTVPRMTPNPI